MIDSTLMLTILPCERVISHEGRDGVINIGALWHHFLFSLYILHLAIFFAIKQLFKTSCLTVKRGKVRLSYILTYFYTSSLGKTNDFVITSLKAATYPSVIDIFFISFLHKTCILFCICFPFCYILKFSGWISCRKKISLLIKVVQ